MPWPGARGLVRLGPGWRWASISQKVIWGGHSELLSSPLCGLFTRPELLRTWWQIQEGTSQEPVFQERKEKRVSPLKGLRCCSLTTVTVQDQPPFEGDGPSRGVRERYEGECMAISDPQGMFKGPEVRIPVPGRRMRSRRDRFSQVG